MVTCGSPSVRTTQGRLITALRRPKALRSQICECESASEPDPCAYVREIAAVNGRCLPVLCMRVGGTGCIDREEELVECVGIGRARQIHQKPSRRPHPEWRGSAVRSSRLVTACHSREITLRRGCQGRSLEGSRLPQSLIASGREGFYTLSVFFTPCPEGGFQRGRRGPALATVYTSFLAPFFISRPMPSKRKSTAMPNHNV